MGFADLNDAQRTRGGFAFVEQRPGLIGFGFAFPAAFEAGGDALREAFDFAPNVTAAQTPAGSEPFRQGEHADADAGVFGIEHDEVFGGFTGGAELLGHFVGNEPAKAIATDMIGPFRLDGLHQGDKVMGGGLDIFPRQQPRIIGQGGGLDDVNRGVRTELGQECAVKERAAIAAMEQEERCAAGAFLQAGEGAAGSTQERAGARVVDGFGKLAQGGRFEEDAKSQSDGKVLTDFLHETQRIKGGAPSGEEVAANANVVVANDVLPEACDVALGVGLWRSEILGCEEGSRVGGGQSAGIEFAVRC